MNFKIDNLQYCNWSKDIFRINNEAKLDAIHVTIAYHEDFREVKKNLESWNKYFKEFKTEYFPSDPIMFITFLSFLSGFPSLFKASLIRLRSKFTVFLNCFFLASRL